MKTLYHYTSIERWRLIEAAGYLKLTESALSRTKEHAGPDVVWLTTDPDLSHDHGLGGTLDGMDKTRVRVAVTLLNRDVHKWKEWAIRRGIEPDWLKALIRVGGSGTWRITEKSIPIGRWAEVLDRTTGAVLHQPA